MGVTVQYVEGNGVQDDQLAISVQLPDANGGNLIVAGVVQPTGGASDSLTPTTIAMPAAPATGSIFLNVQVDPYIVGGTPTIQQSIAAPPAALPSADAISGHVMRIVYSETLTSTSTNPADTGGITPDPALGSV